MARVPPFREPVVDKNGMLTRPWILWYQTETVAPAASSRGTTADRPVLEITDAGYIYFDTDLDKPVIWTGTEWQTWPDTPASEMVSVQNDVTASRVLGTTYQNTTGKPMWVSVVAAGPAGSTLNGYTDAANPPTLIVARMTEPVVDYQLTIYFIVLPTKYYKVVDDVGGLVVSRWMESY